MATVNDAEIVVVGGGAIGCAVAYSLAQAGKTDVLVIEKEYAPASVTSGQAAGLVGQVRSTVERIRLAMHSVAVFIVEASAAVEQRLPGIRPVAFGHLGDGNIHFNLSQPMGADREAFLARWDEFNLLVHDIVMKMGGSFSAEHGIGRLKREELVRYKSPVEVALMRRLKAALDPKGIMNPGKVV